MAKPRTEVAGWSDSDESPAGSRRPSLVSTEAASEPGGEKPKVVAEGSSRQSESPAATEGEGGKPSESSASGGAASKPRKSAAELWTEGRTVNTTPKKSAADLWLSGRPRTPEATGGQGIPLVGLLKQTAKRGVENAESSPKKKKVKAAGDRHYCVLLRSDSLSGPPLIKQWVGDAVPKTIHPTNPHPEMRGIPLSARDPAYRVTMKIGPMTGKEANQFEKDWKKESRSDTKVYQRESIGMDLANKKGHTAKALK